MIWLGSIAATEFFVACQSEGAFRELLAMALLMTAVFAVVPRRRRLFRIEPARSITDVRAKIGIVRPWCERAPHRHATAAVRVLGDKA